MKNVIRWIVVVWALFVGAAPSARAGLIGLYQFNDPTNLGKDTSGNHNDATNFGAIYTSSGFQGGSAFFNGQSFLQSPIDVDPSVMPQMTWGAWVLPAALNPIRAVLSSDNGGFDRDIDLDFRGGSTSWSAFTGNGVLGSGVAPTFAGLVFVAGVYNQFANSLTFYVNGNSFTTTTSFGSSQSIFDIGNNPGFGEFYSGLIDNVFVYNEALSSDQIAKIRATGFPTTPPAAFGLAESVPEPATLTMLGIAAACLIVYAGRSGLRQTS